MKRLNMVVSDCLVVSPLSLNDEIMKLSVLLLSNLMISSYRLYSLIISHSISAVFPITKFRTESNICQVTRTALIACTHQQVYGTFPLSTSMNSLANGDLVDFRFQPRS